ncbi:MAG TPA: MarR family transcriptional regulator [Paraburkholderia sp.]|uniref:MarR family winged helix-turn-helix transcriptional regulator n=1 Tax=Paraburkholderia sp. TaxID=1926495 RepID=UPI002B45AE7F|nr:MarR family transcriptional regulator [Paraburkholderia sp.]HKR40850.1 MarR family transcriptional regulator [Paraburkholderia sp.]
MKTSTTALEQLLTYRIRLLHKLSEHGANERFQATLGISATEARLIAAVGADELISVADLARRINLDKSQASRTVVALLRRGIMRRDANDNDSRLVLVSLTAQGHALNRKATLLARKWDNQHWATLGKMERELLSRAIDKVIKAAQTIL